MLASRRGSGIVAALVAVMMSAAFSGPASAAEGDPYLAECFSGDPVEPCTAVTPEFRGLDILVSPDAEHVYLSARSSTQVRLFDLERFNKLVPRSGAEGCYNGSGAGGCTPVPGLSGSPFDLELSADGSSLYLASGGSLAHLQRNTATGALTPRACYGGLAGCTSINPMTNTRTVEVSKDGRNVYVRGVDQLGVLQRDTETGALTLEPDGEDCFVEDAVTGCTDTYGLGGASYEMDFSPDGKFLYYSIESPGGLGFFRRAANGTLTQLAGAQGGCVTTNGVSSDVGECATPGDGSGPALGEALAATVSPSGKHVFVSGFIGTVVFARDPDVGTLAKVDCVTRSAIATCDQRVASGGLGVAVSPDGKRAAIGASDGGVGVYDFNEATGQLTQLASPVGCFLRSSPPAGCSAFPDSFLYGKAAWAPDGLNFYAAALGPLGNFALDYAPDCVSATVAVPFETSVAAPLSCTDVNGDDTTYEIVSPPTNGVLAAINESAQTVAYDPFGGFSGTDSFTYRGNARGASGEPVTVTLDVAAEGRPVDQGAVDGDADGYPRSQDCDDGNADVNPEAVDLPGNGIDENCSGERSAAGVRGDGTAGAVRANGRRVFRLRGHKADCSGDGGQCVVRAKASANDPKRRIGGSKFTVGAGEMKAIKVRLTKKAFAQLKRLGKLKAKVIITVSRGDGGTRTPVRAPVKPSAG